MTTQSFLGIHLSIPIFYPSISARLIKQELLIYFRYFRMEWIMPWKYLFLTTDF